MVLFVVLIVAACSLGADAQATRTSITATAIAASWTEAPAPTATSTVTLTPTPSATPTFTRTPTATSTVTPTPILGIDVPIVIEDVLVKNSLGFSELLDLSMKVLDAFTQESLKAGKEPIQPKQLGDIFLTLKFNFSGSMDTIDWAASNVQALCGGEAYKATRTGIEFNSEGLLVSWQLHYQIPSDADFGACSLQLPDGRGIPLGRFFSSANLASTPLAEQNPLSITPTSTQESGRIYETDGSFSYAPPEGWEVKEVPDFDYQVAYGTQAGGFIPNLYFFVNKTHRGSLDEYVAESLGHSVTTLTDIKIISQEDFLTDEGERGVKVIMESTQRNTRLRQAEYFFDDGVNKFVATYTRLSDKGQNNDALVDQSMKTFRSDAIQGAAPSSSPEVGESGQYQDDFGAPMVLIPAGSFLMGSESGDDNERPVHQVFLDAFYIDVYEVTNELFARFLNEMGNQEEGGESWLEAGSEYVRIIQRDGEWRPFAGNDCHPVVMVSWYGARAFCEWRGARLPTEAEWEKAARGGLEGALYPWGNDQPVYTFNSENGAQFGNRGATTVPVGSFAPNGYGLYDMAGNVYEWAADWYVAGYYSRSPSENPQGPASSGRRVVRGGSWVNEVYELRVSYRQWGYLTGRFSNFGFRCARSP
ncbi:MAG: SUMF1/EgtB/PvdO family nonheme iron enzyme [Anaerolineales bacterium]|nr:SUMF1/EgtB/PvdO family nonheme iron enzyme [Anaerolineales bacterium]